MANTVLEAESVALVQCVTYIARVTIYCSNLPQSHFSIPYLLVSSAVPMQAESHKGRRADVYRVDTKKKRDTCHQRVMPYCYQLERHFSLASHPRRPWCSFLMGCGHGVGTRKTGRVAD